jgi:hypothetical protein
MSVVEYGAPSGLSNMTVYKKVHSGELESTRNDKGKASIIVRG